MRKEKVIQILSSHLDILRQKFDVAELALFGSVARDESRPDSDLDVLVTYVRTPGLFRFLELKSYLESILGHPVDLVTRKALKAQMRDRVISEAINVH